MVGKGRGKRLTDSERMEIITRLEDPSSQLSKAECARQHGVTPAAISKLMKVSQSVKKRYSDAGEDAGGFRDKRQRGGFSKNVAFEDELFRWICSVRARKVPLLVAHVQSKAKLLATRHNQSDEFKASNGWYYRFCNRYGLTPALVHRTNATSSQVDTINSQPSLEMKREDCEGFQDWTKLRDRIKQYRPECVYTLSEARLFYQLLPKALDAEPRALRTGRETTEIRADTETLHMVQSTPGKTARVLVLVCVNATGTHKIPLLIVGKERVPASAAHGGVSIDGAYFYSGYRTRASYYSQRDIWCNDHTFRHWCERVFVPSIRHHTTQAVLLVAENAGGCRVAFQQENVSTVFLIVRSSSKVNEMGSLSQNTNVDMFQVPHGAVIRDLKRRYKIGLFQERLSFFETPREEELRSLERAAEMPMRSAGVALGCVPHLVDAMSLLDEAWDAVQPSLIHSSWMKSNLGTYLPNGIESQEPSDDAVVMELCFMMRQTRGDVDDLDTLVDDIRHWLSIDDDVSEQMQQELLYDIHQLLQDEEQQLQDSNRDLEPHHHSFLLKKPVDLGMQQQHKAAAFVDVDTLSTSFDPMKAGSYAYRTTDGQSMPVPTIDSSVVVEEKCKSIENVLRTLLKAKDALDNADVAEVFGREAAGQALENISRTLRHLRRIKRGKKSPLAAATMNTATNGDGSESTDAALSIYNYFYDYGVQDMQH